MASTRYLYGSDLNENGSKMDPLQCARSLNSHTLNGVAAHTLEVNALHSERHLLFFINLFCKFYDTLI